MSRNASASSPLAKASAEDLAALTQLSGPFIVHVQRYDPVGTLHEIDWWQGVTIDDLTGDLGKRLADIAGGGQYVLSIFRADSRARVAQQLTLVVPGEPRIPAKYLAAGGVSGMAASSFSPSPFLSSILGVNPTAGQP